MVQLLVKQTVQHLQSSICVVMLSQLGTETGGRIAIAVGYQRGGRKCVYNFLKVKPAVQSGTWCILVTQTVTVLCSSKHEHWC